MDAEKEPKRPAPEKVNELMRMYPLLDQFMCELILSRTDEELAEMLAQKEETKSEEINNNKIINV